MLDSGLRFDFSFCVAKIDKSKLVLLSFPGMVAWGFLIAGFATDNQSLLGVGGAIMIGIIVVGVTIKAMQASAASKERSQLLARGEAATAKVLKISMGRTSHNDHPSVQFELEVTYQGQTYKGLAEAFVSQLAIPRIQPGCEIKVIVDPQDRTSILIDADLTPYGY